MLANFSVFGAFLGRILVYLSSSGVLLSVSQCQNKTSQEPEYLFNVIAKDNRALTLAKKNYCYRAASQWNSLPEHIRLNRRIGQFKSQLKQWIHQNIPKFIDS